MSKHLIIDRDEKGNMFSYKFRYFNTTNEAEQGQGSVPINYYNEFQYNRYFKKIKFNVVAGMVASYSTVRAFKGSDETLTGEFNSLNLGLAFFSILNILLYYIKFLHSYNIILS